VITLHHGHNMHALSTCCALRDAWDVTRMMCVQRPGAATEKGLAFWPAHIGRSAATCSIMRMNALIWGRTPVVPQDVI